MCRMIIIVDDYAMDDPYDMDDYLWSLEETWLFSTVETVEKSIKNDRKKYFQWLE